MAAALLLAGCGTVEGSPAPDKALWDPCQISPDAIAAVGVGPEIAADDFLGGGVTDFDVCRWSGPEFALSVQSTIHTMDEVRANPVYINQAPLAVGSRNALMFENSQDSLGAICSVAFASPVGVLIVSAINSPITRPATSPCDFAIASARTLDPALPQ